MEKRKNILRTVKNYINTELNPPKNIPMIRKEVTGLGINIGGKMYLLSDKQRATLGNKLSEKWVLMIDDISMVSNILFYQHSS